MDPKNKLERVLSDLKPRFSYEGLVINKEELLGQRPYELSSSPDYIDGGYTDSPD